MYQVRENLEASVLEELYVDIIKATGSTEQTDALMREAAEFLGELYSPAELARAAAHDRNALTASIMHVINAAQEARSISIHKKEQVAPERAEQRQRPRAPGEQKIWSGLVALTMPLPEEDAPAIGPDREFWQLCKRGGIHPMIEYLLSAGLVQDLVIHLNDQSDEVIRLTIADATRKILWDEYARTADYSMAEIRAWEERYLRICGYLGGYIDTLLQCQGVSVEIRQRLQRQCKKEGLEKIE